MKLNQVAPDFLEYCRTVRLASPATVDKYQDCLDTWIVPVLGNQRLDGLSRVDLAPLRAAMFARSLSIARTYSVLMVLKGLLRYAREVLAVDTLDPAKVEVPSRGQPHVVYLTDSELALILDAIPVHTYSGSRLRALVELLLGTGMRLGEALALDRDIFDADATEAEIRGKGAKPRTVFFNRRCRYWVRNYLRKRFDSHPALFVTTGLEPQRWARADISRFFINLRDRAGIHKHLTPHVLRHTYCTNLRNRGVDISHIKELVGHTDIETTARYYLGSDRRVLRQLAQEQVKYGAGELLDEGGGFATLKGSLSAGPFP